jgi:hypothetical protein
LSNLSAKSARSFQGCRQHRSATPHLLVPSAPIRPTDEHFYRLYIALGEGGSAARAPCDVAAAACVGRVAVRHECCMWLCRAVGDRRCDRGAMLASLCTTDVWSWGVATIRQRLGLMAARVDEVRRFGACDDAPAGATSGDGAREVDDMRECGVSLMSPARRASVLRCSLHFLRAAIGTMACA